MSNQPQRAQGVWPLCSCAVTDAARPSFQSTLLRLTPCPSSEASGSPAPLTTHGETCAYRRPCGVLTCPRRHAPRCWDRPRQRVALAVCFASLVRYFWPAEWSRRKAHSRFREGPREIRMADLGPCYPVAFARRCFGTRDEAAIGDDILHAGETLDGVDLIEQDEAQDVPDSGHRLEQIQDVGVVLLRRVDDVYSRSLSSGS